MADLKTIEKMIQKLCLDIDKLHNYLANADELVKLGFEYEWCRQMAASMDYIALQIQQKVDDAKENAE